MATRIKVHVKQADSWEVQCCPVTEGCTTLRLLDQGRAFVEAHIGMEEDVKNLVLSLLGYHCRECAAAILKELLAELTDDPAPSCSENRNGQTPSSTIQ
jgi:hypothetical protein